MMTPTYRNLQRPRGRETPWVSFCSGSPAPQGNPRFYKYYWQVFSLECPWVEADFFQHAPVLCNADCEKEVQRLIAKKLSCMIYGFRRPRRDPANPWDLNSPRWEGVTFALSWDEDTDPPIDGGHK